MLRVGAALSLLLASGCIVEAPTGEPAPKERPRATSSAAKTTTVRSGANLGDQIELVAFSVTPGELVPGEIAQASLLLKALKVPDRDWQIFVHVEDGEGRAGRMNLDHAPAGGRLPTSQWKKGDAVRDEFALPLPADLDAQSLNVWVGLWDPKTDQRLPLKKKEAVRNDGKDRILVANVPVAQK